MATDRVRTRCRERLERLAGSRVGGEELEREVVQELSRVIGFDRWCWPAADPSSLLPGPGLAEHNYGPRLPRALLHEYSGADVATKEDAARGSSPAVALSRETGRDLRRSPRWDETLSAAGIGDVAVLACRDQFGCWAWLEIYRDHLDRPFGGADLQLLAQLGPVLGAALRHRVTAGPVDLAGAPDVAGVLLLDDELTPVGETPTVASWFSLLPAAAMFASWQILPPAVYAAGSRVRAGRAPAARLMGRSAAGGWVQIEAAPLGTGELGRNGTGAAPAVGGAPGSSEGIAVTVRAATPREVFDLAARAHGLTSRERQVVARLVQGQDTDDIARTLVISPWTVQDHLKSVFEKVGVHSRGEVRARFGGSATDAEP